MNAPVLRHGILAPGRPPPGSDKSKLLTAWSLRPSKERTMEAAFIVGVCLAVLYLLVS